VGSRRAKRDRLLSKGLGSSNRKNFLGPIGAYGFPCSAERLIGSIRRDCLDHFVILNARHLKRTLSSYFAYYHGSRTHLGLDKQCPHARQVSSVGRIVKIPHLGGLHHRYERIAA
jgi:hypothetical protein